MTSVEGLRVNKFYGSAGGNTESLHAEVRSGGDIAGLRHSAKRDKCSLRFALLAGSVPAT